MPRTLLLADDSITIQKVVAITFAAEDFTVVTVDNGEDAFARARELQPAIILADVAMPRRNGYELSHAIKSDAQLRHIPVLLLAGTFEPLDPAKASAALADGHLIKPFDTQVLIDKVSELLGGAPAAQAPVGFPAPAPVAAARPAAPPQPSPQGAPRPLSPSGFPQRPVPLTQQPAARPSTSPFGIPAAPQAIPPQAIPAAPAAPRPAAVAPPRAPLPLSSPFPSAPSAVPARPQPMQAAPQSVSPFSPPQVAPASPPAASPFAPASAPRPASPAPAIPSAFPRPPAAAPPPAARPASPFPPIQPPAASPAPSPTTNLWGAPPAVPPPARPVAPIPLAPSAPIPLGAPPPSLMPRAPVAAPQAPSPIPRPAPGPERRPGSLTPTWGEQDLRASSFSQPAPSAPTPQFSQDLSVDISGMAEAAAAASVQPSPSDLSLDVRMDEEPPELLPEIDGFELGGSQDLDVSLTGGGSSFVSGALADFSQQGGAAPSEGLEFDDGGAFNQPVELASPHEFLGGPAQPSPAPAAAAPAPSFERTPAPAVASQAPADGEAALRLALSQASREVIERVVWEVVPQLAEIILREHVERMEMERTQA